MKKMFCSWLVGMALVFGPVAAASGAVLANLRIPWSQPIFVPCAAGGLGEVVLLSGTLHVVVQETIDAAGGYHFKFHYNTQGASGVGLTTDAMYRAAGVTQGRDNVRAEGFPFIHMGVSQLTINGMDGGVSFRVHNTVHLTVNANGSVSAEVANSSATCR